MGYRVITLSLDTARDREQIVDRHVPVVEVGVRKMLSDDVVELHMGMGDGIPLLPTDVFPFDEQEPHREGLFITNDVQAGRTVKLLVIDGYTPAGTPFAQS